MQTVIEALYQLRCAASEVEARARAIAVEQSVEMPVEAIDDAHVRGEIVGRVLGVAEVGEGLFEARVALAAETTAAATRYDAGQLLNMLFGNASLLDDVVLHDVVLPPAVLAAFGGPRHGLEGLRARAGAGGRALTCSALKPQGLPAEGLADLARRFAEGGVDYIKDDHGLADQAYSPVAKRISAIAAAVAAANRATGRRTRYIPSLTGDLDALRRGVAIARDHGVDTVMLAPMISGASAMQAIRRDNPHMAILAHPALGGVARIAPPLLFGKLFRLFGADAVVFPNYGGRFGYSPETCRALAGAALGRLGDLRPTAPTPAGGMTLARVPEMLDFYGRDTMLLIGGNLLAAGARLTQETAVFVAGVEGYGYG